MKNGYLTFSVPAEAKIFVNDKVTQTTGAFRRYRTPSIVPGESLTYQVKAVLERDGKKLVQTKVVDLKSGDAKHLEFEFETTPSPVTVLSLNVPAGAEVRLAGNDTAASGPVRLFTTTQLKQGETWKDYRIEVAAKINGKRVVKSRTIDLRAGDSVDLEFDFGNDISQVASR